MCLSATMWLQNILQLNAISVQRFTGILRRSEKYCSTYLKLSNIHLLLEESSIISCFNVSIASTLLMYRIVQNDKYSNSFLWLIFLEWQKLSKSLCTQENKSYLFYCWQPVCPSGLCEKQYFQSVQIINVSEEFQK